MGETLTFRTPMARVLTIGVAVVAVVALAYFVSDGGIRELWRSGPTVLCIVVVTWALFWRPQVQVSDGGVTVANILRTVHVPWPVLRAVDSKWSLTVTAADLTVSAWAVPASSGMAARTRRPGARGGQETASPLKSSGNADAAALAIAQRREALVEAGHLKAQPIGSLSPQTTWNLPEAAALAGSLLLAVASYLFS
ncbi:PH domain-containing protein [Ruania zhangjianzhongii]|uniref:PH domain-containing protein n=1 Tax=Ruania zhangjianzhongii TaxID=2603206 RepID=UPI0011CA00F7|nr:PH domain-containing protein [Ruania zhangjianzhongii]